MPISASQFDLQRVYEPSRLFDDATSEYLRIVQAPVTVPPFTVCCWAYSDNTAAAQTLFDIADASVVDHQFALLLRGDLGGDPAEFMARAGAWESAFTTTGYSANTWHHYTGQAKTATSRAVYIDAGSIGTNVANVVPANLDVMDIGQMGDSTPGLWLSGRVFWLCLWNVILPLGELAALANRQHPTPPWKIRPESIVAMPDMRTLWDPYMKARWTPSGTVPANPYQIWRPYRSLFPANPLLAMVHPELRHWGRGTVYELTWQADDDGSATLWLDGVRAPLLRGIIHRAETLPSAADIPTANYDITLETRLGADVLGGALADRSATAAEMAFPYYSLGTSGHGERSTIRCLEFKVANAGSGGAGVTAFYVLQL